MSDYIGEMDKWANERQRLAQAGQKTMQRLRESQAQLEQDRVDANRYRKLKAKLKEHYSDRAFGLWLHPDVSPPFNDFDGAVDYLPEVPE